MQQFDLTSEELQELRAAHKAAKKIQLQMHIELML